jgi:hypothetical protein
MFLLFIKSIISLLNAVELSTQGICPEPGITLKMEPSIISAIVCITSFLLLPSGMINRLFFYFVWPIIAVPIYQVQDVLSINSGYRFGQRSFDHRCYDHCFIIWCCIFRTYIPVHKKITRFVF